jgi:hypothetical protein
MPRCRVVEASEAEVEALLARLRAGHPEGGG